MNAAATGSQPGWRGLAETVWYGRHPLGIALAPLGWLYAGGMIVRQALYALRVLPSKRITAPVIVVGNISVGGTGKTPLVIWIAERLRAAGLHPGLVSRGYGGAARGWPQQVRADSDPTAVGDEPVLLARHAGCPVAAAGGNRAVAALALVTQGHCDVVVSDDGLQHLALRREIEIAVLDGTRRHGNGRCLPAGPLREPRLRLRRVDFVVAKGAAAAGEVEMRLRPGDAVNVRDSGIRRPLTDFRGGRVHALCGIGNPHGFFAMLAGLGLDVIPHAFADHHDFGADDIVFADGRPVLMTEKDAVKCAAFAAAQHWYVPVHAELPVEFETDLLQRLAERSPQLAATLEAARARRATE